jgi:hypothetical protein
MKRLAFGHDGSKIPTTPDSSPTPCPEGDGSSSRLPTSVEKEPIMTTAKITPKSLALFLAYAKDAVHWSGRPCLGANVPFTAADRGNLSQLKKAELLTTTYDEECGLAYITFTDAGKALAQQHGISTEEWW